MAARGNRLAKCSKRLSPTPKSSCVRANTYRGALDATVLLYCVPTTTSLSHGECDRHFLPANGWLRPACPEAGSDALSAFADFDTCDGFFARPPPCAAVAH